MNFYTIQSLLDNLAKQQKVVALGCQDDTLFLNEMQVVYQDIRTSGIARIHDLLETTYKDVVGFFLHSIGPFVADLIQNTKDLEFEQTFHTLDFKLQAFERFYRQIDTLDVDIKNHHLMKVFLIDVTNSLVYKDIPQKINEFDELVEDIQSQLNLAEMLKINSDLLNRFPALQNEINKKIESNGRNQDNLLLFSQKKLSNIRIFTYELNNQKPEIVNHKIMIDFVSKINAELTTKNINQWKTNLPKIVSDCEDDLRYHNGWLVGNYRCYGNGVIYDTETKLSWYLIPNTAFFTETDKYIHDTNNNNFHGKSNWRLPFKEEFKFHENSEKAGFIASTYWTQSKANYFKVFIARVKYNIHCDNKFFFHNRLLDLLAIVIVMIIFVPFTSLFEVLCIKISQMRIVKIVYQPKEGVKNHILLVSESES